MKVLSIRQPWAWLILHAGKDIENRDWVEKQPALHDARRLVHSRDQFLIHVGKGMTRGEYDDVADFVAQGGERLGNIVFPGVDQLDRGGIVGIARLTEIVRRHRSPWFFGQIGLVLAEAAPLPFRPLKGQLGFFDAPPDFVPMRRGGVWQWSGAA